MCLARHAICGLLALCLAGPLNAEESAAPDFQRDIRPILSDKCFHCHGPDAHTREADLRLDDSEDAMRDRDGRRAVDPERPQASLLLERISSSGDDRMPPPDSHKELTGDERDVLQRWILAGGRFDRHWAWIAPGRPDPPAVHDAAWPANDIDRFVLAALERQGLTPSPEADPATLVRRVTFDLTGLPPEPADVDAFVRDPSPAAWEALVDRLLASDASAERLAMWWLDLVRYADTVGYHGDQDQNISPYRDYVIDAFSRNLPLDVFSREQLAGDLVPDSGDDQKIASGYNRMLQTSHEGGVQPREYLTIYAADRVRNFSTVWLGGSLGCAQCHDHKYDPFTQADFYATVAFFADIDESKHFTQSSDTVPAPRPPEARLLTRRERERLAELRAARNALAPAGGAPEGSDDAVTKAAASSAGDRARLLDDEIQAIESAARLTQITVTVEPREIRLLPRGNWLDDSGPVMQPAIPAFLGALDVGPRRANRLDLADWLFDVERGYGLHSARVFANRLWSHCFGEGLSRSMEDFGGQGEPPTHPELLDHLSVAFADSGWDVRALLKRIVMSRTYRQSSDASPELLRGDPENRRLARQGRFRVPAESVRDSALAISGLLVRDVGGGSVKPYQPAKYYEHLNFPTREYRPHHDQRQWRRGVYMHWQRQYLHPMLKAFDAPSREECTAQRQRSNTPLTALVLLNDPTFLEAARVFAARIQREGSGEDGARLEFAFRRALSREPDQVERDTLLALLTAARREFAEEPDSAAALLAVGDAPQDDDLDPLETAAWMTVARAILNLGETYLRR
ncbi:MAG: PSD1 domain-containing protein [Planctomyces sp.]|nr:PSD1 domain-containing protein [Planctomyces sp.]